jgi:hypothetical protein
VLNIRTRRRRVLVLLLTVLVLTSVSGCFRYRSAAVIDQDGTVSGSVLIGYGRDLIQVGKELNGQQSDPVGELHRFLQANAASVATGTATVVPYSADGFTGFETTFSKVATADYLKLLRHEEQGGDAPDVLFRLDREDGHYAFSAELEPTKPGQLTLPAEAFEGVEITLSLTFPGPVTQANGDVSGNTVTWRPRLPDQSRLEAVGEASTRPVPIAEPSPIPASTDGTDSTASAGGNDGGDGNSAVVLLLLACAAALLAAAAAIAITRWRRTHQRAGQEPR